MAPHFGFAAYYCTLCQHFSWWHAYKGFYSGHYATCFRLMFLHIAQGGAWYVTYRWDFIAHLAFRMPHTWCSLRSRRSSLPYWLSPVIFAWLYMPIFRAICRMSRALSLSRHSRFLWQKPTWLMAVFRCCRAIDLNDISSRELINDFTYTSYAHGSGRPPALTSISFLSFNFSRCRGAADVMLAAEFMNYFKRGENRWLHMLFHFHTHLQMSDIILAPGRWWLPSCISGAYLHSFTYGLTAYRHFMPLFRIESYWFISSLYMILNAWI